jgi:hypothetical protein
MRKFRWGFKKEDFFFNQRDKRKFFSVLRVGGMAGGAALVLAIFISGMAGAVRQCELGERKTREAAAVESARTAGRESPASVRRIRIALNDFILPDEAGKMLAPVWMPYRECVGRWDEKKVGAFWIPPPRGGLEKLKKANDKNIEILFEDVP